MSGYGGGSASCKTVCTIKAGDTSGSCSIPVENGKINNCPISATGNCNVTISGTLSSDPAGCVTGDLSGEDITPVDKDKIEIKIGTLSAKYGGSACRPAGTARRCAAIPHARDGTAAR